MPKKRANGDIEADNKGDEELADSESGEEIVVNKGKSSKRKKQRPDPLFKELLTEAAIEANFKGKPNELQV